MKPTKTYYFKWALPRIFLIFLLLLNVAIYSLLAYDIWWEETNDYIFFSLILALVMPITTYMCWAASLKPCFLTGTALEIYPDHLVVATKRGMTHLPRTAILGFVELNNVPLHQVYLLQMVTFDVLPEYKTKSWYWGDSNPSLPVLFVKDARQLDILSELSHWRAGANITNQQ